MKAFSALLERLYYTPGSLNKQALLCDYFATTPDPDRGTALAIIGGTLDLPNFRRSMVLDLIRARCDPYLLALCQDYVGELSETVAHLWPGQPTGDEPLPSLHELVETLRHTGKLDMPATVAALLDRMTSPQRWALLKIGGGNLRIGVSARFLKQVLAQYGHQPVEKIESLWHGLEMPYTDLFAWLEGRAEEPRVNQRLTFTPVMLAQPLEEKDQARLHPDLYAAEWKYDGIRVQLTHTPLGKALFTRTGDDIGAAFPDVLERMTFHGVLDGELLVQEEGVVGSFNQLQQRLNRKTASAKLIARYPTVLIAYDALFLDDQDIRTLPYDLRRDRLRLALERYAPERMELSPQLAFQTIEDLRLLRASCEDHATLEGLMLKQRASPYVAGRPTGPWYKWKKEPRLLDAVVMYAQRGSGKRSSFYSDFTFGLWRDDELLPIGKAYFGFTDAELAQLDKWVRHHIVNKFGPVVEVSKELVFEVAFDAAQVSTRHKSGYALRFPRVHRIRWDKPAAEADRLSALAALVR